MKSNTNFNLFYITNSTYIVSYKQHPSQHVPLNRPDNVYKKSILENTKITTIAIQDLDLAVVYDITRDISTTFVRSSRGACSVPPTCSRRRRRARRECRLKRPRCVRERVGRYCSE